MEGNRPNFISWRNREIFREGSVIWKDLYESVLLITSKGRLIKTSCCLYIMHANIVRVCSKSIHELATFTDHEGFWWYDWHFVYTKQQRVIVACNTQCQCHECQEWTLTVYNLVASTLSWHPVYLDEKTMTWPRFISYRCLVKGIWTLQVYQYKEILESDAVYCGTWLANYTVLDDIKIGINLRQSLRLHALCVTLKKVTNKLFGNVADFKCLLKAVTNHIKDSGKVGYIPFKILHTVFFSLIVLR